MKLLAIISVLITILKLIKCEANDELLPLPKDTLMKLPDASKDFESGKYFEGDMKLTSEQEDFFMKNNKNSISLFTGIIHPFFHWPKDSSKNVIVPYVIDNSANYSFDEKAMIRNAMDYIEHYTCIKFVERSNQSDYLNIISANGYWSSVGKLGGKQNISFLKRGCFMIGTIMHELIHSLGFTHMQNHEDRDEYVEILWENVDEDYESNFKLNSPKIFQNYGTAYDYLSVMHYHPSAFSKNGKNTIVVKDDMYKDKTGQRMGLSQGDVKRINNMYQCDK